MFEVTFNRRRIRTPVMNTISNIHSRTTDLETDRFRDKPSVSGFEVLCSDVRSRLQLKLVLINDGSIGINGSGSLPVVPEGL